MYVYIERERLRERERVRERERGLTRNREICARVYHWPLLAPRHRARRSRASRGTDESLAPPTRDNRYHRYVSIDIDLDICICIWRERESEFER